MSGTTGGSAASRTHGVSPYRYALELVTSRRSAEPESSVTISRNAKGVAQFEVVVRGVDEMMCDAKARRIFEDLTAAYPYPVET